MLACTPRGHIGTVATDCTGDGAASPCTSAGKQNRKTFANVEGAFAHRPRPEAPPLSLRLQQQACVASALCWSSSGTAQLHWTSNHGEELSCANQTEPNRLNLSANHFPHVQSAPAPGVTSTRILIAPYKQPSWCGCSLPQSWPRPAPQVVGAVCPER